MYQETGTKMYQKEGTKNILYKVNRVLTISKNVNFPLISLNRSLALKFIKNQIGIEDIYYGALNRYNLSLFKD